MNAVITCEQVTKKYGDVLAVDDINLEVDEGEIFGLVGPNGAGKTTLIEMIESLRTPDRGSIQVLGWDPGAQDAELRERIGIQLQTTSIQPNLTVREALVLFASLYRNPLLEPLELLATLSLEDKAGSRFRKLSGGQKQRVAIALALVNDPAVLFFDEITTGLDPQARRNMWQLVEDIRDRGKTVFLTTHYMEEAEELCDRVGVIDHGRIIALDSPRNLVARFGGVSRIWFTVGGADSPVADLETLPAVTQVERRCDEYVLSTADDSATLQALVRMADGKGFRVNGIRTASPNLDDVFLNLTGRELRE